MWGYVRWGVCDVMWGYVRWGYVMLCEDMWCYVRICDVMWGYVMSCEDMLCEDMWCHVRGYVMLCEDMWCQVRLKVQYLQPVFWFHNHRILGTKLKEWEIHAILKVTVELLLTFWLNAPVVIRAKVKEVWTNITIYSHALLRIHYWGYMSFLQLLTVRRTGEGLVSFLMTLWEDRKNGRKGLIVHRHIRARNNKSKYRR